MSLPGIGSLAFQLLCWSIVAVGDIVASPDGKAVSNPRVQLSLHDVNGSRRDVAFPVNVVRVENRNGLLNFAFAGPQDMLFQVNGLTVPDDQPDLSVPGTAYQLVLMNTPWAEEAFTGPDEPDRMSRCSWQGQIFPKTLSGEAVVRSPTGRHITVTWSVQIDSWPQAQVIAPRRIPSK